ncbi:TPA: hypothetical protein DEO28_04860 [Candidatus Dependentiae bacterium]|nr:MAG: Outer membrane efflux protein [candidate division TM6 bacterium GW2011_GWE2_31_21]KKP53882.1 MAG: Outer membrane efflux protein [candidate division TM6 bacterium GW2011_GWF2_33_332]HBS47662.1 hypothetical protein [Candidatus Dependentiae bacterium]HBZ73811.1 hypothetical protein [Candidatus Dependentiae bacterium]
MNKKLLYLFTFLVLSTHVALIAKDEPCNTVTVQKNQSTNSKPDQATIIPKQEPKTIPTLTIMDLTIPKAIEMGYQYSNSIMESECDIKSANYIAKSALSGYFPQITAETSEQFVEHKEGLKPEVNLGVSQLLYSFGGPLEQYKINKKDVSIAKYQKEIATDLVRNQVETSFLRCWVTEKKIAFIKALNKSAIEQFEKSREAYKVGLISKNQFMQAQATYEKNIADVKSYEDQLISIRKTFEYYIGTEIYSQPNTNVNLMWDKDNPLPKLESFKTYQTKALENRKELKAKQKEIEKAKLQSKYYINQYLPSVSVLGNQTFTKQSAFSPVNYFGNAGVSLNWNIFDGLANKHLQSAAKAQKAKAILEKDDLHDDITEEVQKAYYQLNILLKELEAKNAELAQAKNQFLLRNEEFTVGLISKVDFEAAKTSWEKAQFDWLELRVAVEIKYMDLNFACGYPKN